jgi:uncharacterized ion transporter superfamily protein YfcC
MEVTMKLRAKFAVIMFLLTFVFALAYVAHAGSARNQLTGQGTDKAVSTTDNQNIQAQSGSGIKAPGPYKYNYNERHGVTNDFGQDKAGGENKF